MSEKPTQAVTTTGEKGVEFIPFGSQDKIKLSVAMIKNLIAVKTKKGAVCSDTDAIKFIAMCQARRLNPFEGDAFLIGYDTNDGPKFSLITAHQAFLKRAEMHPEFDGMKSGIIIERNGQVTDVEGDFFLPGDKVLGGWATVFFKTRKQAMHKRVRLERFKKPFGIWVDDPAGMICKCAEADALRSAFPTMLGGLYLKEELVSDQKKMDTPIFDKKSTTINVDAAPADPPPAPASQPTVLLDLCKKDGISEPDLLNFLDATFGLSVNSLNELDSDSVTMIQDKWGDIVEGIQEASSK